MKEYNHKIEVTDQKRFNELSEEVMNTKPLLQR